MVVYQKYGVIGLSVTFAILQKLKYQIFRLLIVYDSCRNANQCANITVENNSDIFFENEDIAQFIFKTILINNCVAILPCIFFASWSDKHGRKLLLSIPFAGSLIGDVLMLIFIFVPSAPTSLFLVSEAIHGLFGGSVLIGIGCICYITDSTDHRRRTWIIGLFFGLYNLIPVIDRLLQYYWSPLQIQLDWKTLVWVGISIRMILSVYFLVYVRVLVVESVFVLGTYQGSPLANLLTPINVTDTVSCVFKRRMDNIRSFIIALTTVFVFYCILLYGDIFLFPRHFHQVFEWSFRDILILFIILTGLQVTTLLVCNYTTLRCRVFDMDLGIYGGLSLATSCLILTFTRNEWVAVLGMVAGMASLLVPTCVISVLSKLIERIETGSMYAGIGFIVLTTQLVSISSYQALEKICTEAGLPQVVFLLPFGLTTFALLFLTFLKKKIAPDLLGHLTGSESLALINRKRESEHI